MSGDDGTVRVRRRRTQGGRAGAGAANVNDETALRPSSFEGIIGNAEAIEPLRRACAAANERGDMPGHVLLVGPPGTGKTTIAGALAHELHAPLTVLFGPNMRSDKDLTGVLLKMSAAVGTGTARFVLMVDEIHRMYGPVQEKLYTVMEDGVYRFGDGSALPLSPITIVGATTDPDRLLSPMLDRFTYTVRLRLYTVDELAAIAARAARTLGFRMTESAANAVARASEGTPRIAIKMTRVLRDYAHKLTAATFAEWQSVSGASAKAPGPGPWVTDADVNALLAEPALLWQLDGRDASGRSA